MRVNAFQTLGGYQGIITEAPKAPRSRRLGVKGGEEWGGDIPLPSRLGGLGERRELPQQAENGFLRIWTLKEGF